MMAAATPSEIFAKVVIGHFLYRFAHYRWGGVVVKFDVGKLPKARSRLYGVNTPKEWML
jgi:hypothetical protein